MTLLNCLRPWVSL